MTTDTTGGVRRKTRQKDGPAWPKGKRVVLVRLAPANSRDAFAGRGSACAGISRATVGTKGDIVAPTDTIPGVYVKFDCDELPTIYTQEQALYCLEPCDE